MKQTILSLCFLFFAGVAICQPTYTLPQPEKWGTEKIPFPIAFAPAIPFKGMEEIRFTPGWANDKSEEYWSYAFVWFVEGSPVINRDSLTQYFTQYYTGLYFTNQKESPTGNRLFTSVVVAGGGDNYPFMVNTINFLNKQHLTLKGRLQVRRYPAINRTALLVEISPQDYVHPVWSALDGIVNGFKINGGK